MNIFESIAHALIGEHGRRLFRRDYHSGSTYGFETSFWKIALLCYGKDFYKLPQKTNMAPPSREPKTFSFPAFTVEGSMHLGIPLPELLLYQTVGGYEHRFTPIHLATGLLLYGGDYYEADELLQIEFMKKLWPEGRPPSDFVNQTTVNPYKPEEVGRKPYDIRLFQKDESNYMLFDELGSALWFPTELVEHSVGSVATELWFHSIFVLSNLDPRYDKLRTQAARRQLFATSTGKKETYRKLATYIRQATKSDATSYVRNKNVGVAAVASCFRGDADAEMMASGLRIIATATSDNLQQAYRYIGRPLTYEDLELLAPQHALTILRNAPYELVKDVIATNGEKLSSLFFKLPSNRLKEVMDCMSPNGREDKWFSDTPEGNDSLVSSTTPLDTKGHKDTWSSIMQPYIARYIEARAWRKQLLDIAAPDVAFLALMYAVAGDEDPVPRDAIWNVLVSHPNAGGILEHVKMNPVKVSTYSRL